MATYTIKINEKSKKAKTFIKFLTDYAQTSEDISIKRERVPGAVKETEYIMSSPAMLERIRSAEKHMKEGKGREYSLDELKKKMGL
ncbi:MAG: hypothetical protein ABFD10_11065 [Prolixibacteraceae bacterium]